MTPDPKMVERLALLVGDKLGGSPGLGAHYRHWRDIRWEQSVEIAKAALEASHHAELVEALEAALEDVDPFKCNPWVASATAVLAKIGGEQ